MSYANVFGDVIISKLQKQGYQHLNPENEESLKFLEELSSLKAITDKVIMQYPFEVVSLSCSYRWTQIQK